MQLYEKLNFIMNLTHTQNRTLASELHVDPSLISRLRTGKRGVPRNQEHLKIMAQYFSKQCNTDYQQQVLSEMLGISQSCTIDYDQLWKIIYYWLRGDTEKVDRFMQSFDAIKIDEINSGLSVKSESQTNNRSVFYGNSGKRTAAQAVFQHLLSIDQTGTIFIFADEEDDWIIEDCKFTAKLQDWALKLIKRGYRFCHIAPPISSNDLALESLNRWIPVYMTGQVTAYYYPRFRDNVHRRTLFLLPGEIAMLSNSIACQHTSFASFLITDKQLLPSYEAEFKAYLSLCSPMLDIRRSRKEMVQSFIQFLTPTGARIQKISSLSSETAPPELVINCIEKRKNEALKKLGSQYMNEIYNAERDWDKSPLIDIACLASADQVRSGMVPIISSWGTEEIIYYTPATYAMHLNNILRLLETSENYHFVPIPFKYEKESILMFKENHRALLVHMENPFAVLEITQPGIVSLYREYLLQLADKIGYTDMNRNNIISRIKALIQELQE